ncbi:MAG: hypothetical protein KGZ79_04485 [Dethiobacter sp.]|jgi:uncharacterized membrane-anchored protein|nr:hypothetical protein [Dethiobacter sp.]
MRGCCGSGKNNNNDQEKSGAPAPWFLWFTAGLLIIALYYLLNGSI